MALATKLVTAEELLRMPREGRVELVDGEVRKMSPAGYEHAEIAMIVGESLRTFVLKHGLGTAIASELGFILRRNPDTVSAPDVAFIRTERLSRTSGYFVGPPDLAVEVISPNDTYTEVNEKVVDWLEGGVRLVIVIDPRKQNAFIHRSRKEITEITIDGTLDGGDVVPGWQLPMRDLFVP
jgi:Uma2 family endonuclease